MPRLPTEPPLVGRDQEIGQLMQYLHSALDGNGAAVFISGEAGIGKTRLVNEFLTLVKKEGAGIFAGWCLSEANIPYFPFREAFKSYISAISDEKTKSAVSKQLRTTGWFEQEFAQKPEKHEPYLTPQIERDRTFETTARVLIQLSAQKPLVLFVDDLHWADPLSLALLHYLSRECRKSRLLIIGTYRLEELAHTEGEEHHPLEEAMFVMSRDDLLTKMKLPPLKRHDFPELLKSMFRSSLSREFEEKLFEETEGNPLFVVEMLNMLVSEGCLSEKDGHWILTAPVEKIGIPSKVYEVIDRRIRRLDHEKRKLLEIAAVCGQSFTPAILSSALSVDLTDVWQMLVELEQQHRLIRSIDSEFEFTHHKIREVIYGNLPNELRRIHHLKIARCLEQALTKQITDGYMADMALHSIEGGAPEKAFEYLIRLGEKAVQMAASEQAIDYVNKALEATQETPSLATGTHLAKIYKHRGTAWLQLEQRKKAIDDFSLMLQNATGLNDELLITEAHHLLGSTYQPYFGEMDEAMHHLTTAVEMARKICNKPLEAKILTEIGYALFWSLETRDESRRRFEESSKICKEVGDKVTEAGNLLWLGMHYNWNGEFSQAKENIHKAIVLAEEVRGKPAVFTRWCFGMVLAGNGEYNEAISTLQRCLQLARDSGLWSTAAMILNTLGWICGDLANVDLAIKYNNEALEVVRIYQRGRASGAVPSAYENLAFDYLRKNDYEEAERYFKEVENTYEQHRQGYWLIESRVRLGRGIIALAKGDYMQALKSAEDSMATHKKSGRKKFLAKSLKLKAEVLAKMGNIEEAIALMEDALNVAQQVGNPPLLWQIHYSRGLLEEEHGDVRNAREHYTKAIALIEAVASQLNDVVLKSALLTSPETRAVRDAIDRSMPDVAERAAGSNGYDAVKIMASISVPNEFVPSEAFEVKLDVANVGKRPGLLVRIDDLVPRRCEVMRVPYYCTLEGSSLNMRGRRLDPLSVESVSVSVQIADVVGVSLSPQVIYVDELGEFRTIRVEEAKILPVVEFKSKAAQVVFNYLVDAFVEDCVKRRLGVEKSGWRSFPQIIKGAGVSKRSLYGAGGRLGHGLSELQRKGLVDLETFVGERGRGGHILRVRVHHSKESVKRYVKEKAPDLLI
jgi:predicted ATPase